MSVNSRRGSTTLQEYWDLVKIKTEEESFFNKLDRELLKRSGYVFYANVLISNDKALERVAIEKIEKKKAYLEEKAITMDLTNKSALVFILETWEKMIAKLLVEQIDVSYYSLQSEYKTIASIFFLFAEIYNVSIPIRLKGWIIKSLVSYYFTGYQYTGGKSTSILKYLAQLQNAMIADKDKLILNKWITDNFYKKTCNLNVIKEMLSMEIFFIPEKTMFAQHYREYLSFVSNIQLVYGKLCKQAKIESTRFVPEKEQLVIIPTQNDYENYMSEMCKSAVVGQSSKFKKCSLITKEWVKLQLESNIQWKKEPQFLNNFVQRANVPVGHTVLS